MARYVIFPGTAGSYADTPDVNLFDADTAHLFQTKGTWIPRANVTVAATPSVPPVPPSPTAGGQGLLITVSTAASNASIRDGNGATAPVTAVNPSTEYTAGTLIYTDVADREAWIQSTFYDSGGSSLGNQNGGVVPLVTGAWTLIPNTQTSPALTAKVETRIFFQPLNLVGDTSIGDEWWIASNIIQAGSVATFVPSLRIVGDLDLRAKVAATDWTSGTAQMFIDNLSGSAGYRFYIGSTGLISFDGRGTVGLITESAPIALTDGTAYELRAALDVSAGILTWYKDGVAETPDENFTAQALLGSDNALAVGALSGGASNNFGGDMYTASVRDGIDGPIVAIFDAEDIGL